MGDHGAVLDNRVEFSDNLRLIIDHETETVSTSRSSSQMSLNNGSNSSNVADSRPNGTVYAKSQNERSQRSERDLENGVVRRFDSVDVFKHCHQQFLPPQDKTAQRQLIIAATMCLCFLVGEFIGKLISTFTQLKFLKKYEDIMFYYARWLLCAQFSNYDRRRSFVERFCEFFDFTFFCMVGSTTSDEKIVVRLLSSRYCVFFY